MRDQRDEIAVNCFSVTGIYPLNKNDFSNADFTLSQSHRLSKKKSRGIFVDSLHSDTQNIR